MNALEELLDNLNGSNEFIDEDEESSDNLRFPVLKLKQNTTNDPNCPTESVAGDLYLPGLKIEQPVEALVLMIWTSRVLWEDPSSSTIDCSSFDNKHGMAKGILCKECDLSGWSKDATGKAVPPECTETINAVMITKDLENIFLVRFSKTSFRAGKILMRAAGSNPRGIFALTTTSKTSGRNVYFIQEIRPTGKRADPGLAEVQSYFGKQLREDRAKFKDMMVKRWESEDTQQIEDKSDEDVVTTTVVVDGDDPDFDNDL
jgi:hypothetical protein